MIMEKQHRVPKTPFKCNKAAELGVSGAIFEIFTKLPSDYMCIWGGPREDCTFNHLVNFLYHYKETHQFAFANFLVDLPIRRCMHNIGVPLLDDRIVIIGRVMDNKGNTYSPSRMFTNLLKPFHSETWIVFSALFLTIFTLAALVVRFLGPKKELSLSRTLLFLMGNHEVAQDPHHHRYTISIISLFLNSSIVALSAIMVLFYEIAVVNFLFRQSSIPSLIDVGSIPHEDLMQYCVNKNSAVDIVWRSSLKNGTAESLANGLPFAPNSSSSDCIDQIRKGFRDGRGRFAVVLESSGGYLLSKKGLCGAAERDLVIYKTDVLYNFNGGFLYNTNVSEVVRGDVGNLITQLKMQGELQKIFGKYLNGKENCTDGPTGAITLSTVIFPILLLVIPCLFGSLLSVMREAIRQRNQNTTSASSSAPSIPDNCDETSEGGSQNYSSDLEFCRKRKNLTQGSTSSDDNV